MKRYILLPLSVAMITVASAAEISPALKSLQGKWNGERVNSDGQKSKVVLEIKDDKLEYRVLNNDGELRFVAKGTVKIEKAGDFRILTAAELRAGRDEGNLEPVDDDRSSPYVIREGKLYLASGFDKARDNERPRVEEYTKQEGGARSSAEKPANDKLLGKWKLEAQFGDQTMDYDLRFNRAGDAVQGAVISPRSGEHKAKSVTLKGDQLEMLIDRQIEGNNVTFVYNGTLKDDTLAGTFKVKGLEQEFSGTFKATR
ncbi:MAG TPA: hypothetical protein VJ063_21745 [Verrucomicrobiae bacterium]|nr:hypothetical protein [Verrucomicrobiae bacterium]